MIKTLILFFALSLPANISFAMPDTPGNWQNEIISLVSHQKFKEAGEKVKEHCVDRKNADLCLILASAFFEGEAKFGINSKDIIEAYKYTKLACDYGNDSGCKAYKSAIEKGELLIYVLFEPGVKEREQQLDKAIQLGADLNAKTLFSMTLLQKAINEENTEIVKLLLKKDVDVNYRVDNEDLTSLMYAVNSGNKDMVKLLLDHGADPKQLMKAAEYLEMDKKEANACDFAQKLKQQEIMSLLKCNNTKTAESYD